MEFSMKKTIQLLGMVTWPDSFQAPLWVARGGHQHTAGLMAPAQQHLALSHIQ